MAETFKVGLLLTAAESWVHLAELSSSFSLQNLVVVVPAFRRFLFRLSPRPEERSFELGRVISLDIHSHDVRQVCPLDHSVEEVSLISKILSERPDLM